ncbi:MAG: GNAT family N-acetyltransferase [Sphingomonadales bacterium]|nr:GNAT family N-acetyltransferase [Sphingomonadales bacterium]MDE2168639.1 GNAT family N-acetyltransferase [Sphingomonadales bacterium]
MPGAVLRLVQPSTMGKPHEMARWQRLARQASEPNPFLEEWYLLPALRAMGAEEVTLACLEADGDLLGLMPLARNWHYYGRPIPHLAGWSHPNSFLGAPLVARGMEPVFWRALLSHADAHAGMALFLHLTHVPLEGALTGALRQVLAEEGRPHGLVWREERAALASPLLPEDYLEASLSGKKRKELRRQYARLSELGKVDTIRQRDATDLAPWIEDFLALEAAGWKGAAGSALSCSPATAALFREALTGAAASGRLERLALRLDGRAIAMLASFVTPPMAFSYKTAFDESLSRYSPGVLLQRDNLSLLLDRDIAMTDSCASADHPMIDHLWRERRSVGRLSIAIGGRARQAAFGAVLRREQQVDW